MANYDLGTAKGVIEIEYKGDGAKKARDDLKATESGSTSTGAALKDVGNKAGIAGLLMAGGFGLAVKSASDFEKQMSGIGAVSGASEAELEQLRNKALQLGKDTQFSASESAQAIEELVKAGIPIADVMNGAADSVVALAAAGGVDMPTAATIASNAMNQFGLKAQDMKGVVDSIAGAANASAIDVTDLGMAMSQVGAVANLAGLDFKDTAIAIAEMGNAGIKGSDAGTSLKSMLMNLQPQTDKQKGLMKDLGLITKDGSNAFYDATGKLKSLKDIQDIMSKSLSGMSQAQRQAALEVIFGSDGIRAAAILTKEGAAGYDQMAASMGKVSAADVAAKRMDNFKGSMEQFMGSVETLGITVGTVLLPALRTLVDMLTGVANWFLNLDGTTRNIIIAFLGFVTVALLVIAAVIKIVQFIQAFQATLAVLRIAMASTWIAALGPIALVIAAIALIVGIIILLWNKSETFRNIVLGIWEAIKKAVSAVASWFTDTFLPAMVSVWNGIVAGLQALAGFFKAIWDAIVAVVTFVFNLIKTIITTYINIWLTIITTVLNVLKAIWEAFWNTFGAFFKAIWDLIVAILKLAWTIIVGVVTTYLNILKAFWTTVWNAIAAVFQFVWNLIKTIVTTYINIVRTVITTVLNVIKAIFTAVWNAILAVINAVWNAIGGKVTAAVNLIKGVIQTAWNIIKTATSTTWNALLSIISTAWSKAYAFVTTIKDKVIGFFAGAASWLLNAGSKIIKGLADGILNGLHYVTDAIGSVTSWIADHLPGSPVKVGPLRVLNNGYTGRKIGEMVADGVLQSQPELARAINTIVNVPALTKGVARAASPAGLSIAADRVGSIATRGAATAAGAQGGTVNVTVNNPVPERASESLYRQGQKLAMVG